MAVAVKTSPGARSDSPTKSPAVLSLIGVAYLLGCLAIVFKILPWIWWSIFEAVGLSRAFSVEAGALLVLLCLALGIGMLVFGGRLLGPHPPKGVRGGVFIGFVGLLVVLLVSRWASLWLEHWVDRAQISVTVGVIGACVVLAALLGGAIRLFLLPRVQKAAVTLEDAGWFTATSHKPNQGKLVRRATIIGILLLVVAGIWTLISHGTLRRMPEDWVLDVPFTGEVHVDNYGDVRPFVAKVQGNQSLDVEVLTVGGSNFKEHDETGGDSYRKVVLDIAKENGLEGELRVAERNLEGQPEAADGKGGDTKDITVLQLAVNQVILDRMKAILDERGKDRIFENDSALRRLREAYLATGGSESHPADIHNAVLVFEREAKQFKKTEALGPQFKLPTALLILDRPSLRRLNDETDEKKHVKVGFTTQRFRTPGMDRDFRYGEVVTAEDFGKAEVWVCYNMANLRLGPALNGPQRDRARSVLKGLAESSSAADFKGKLEAAAAEEAGPLGRELSSLKDEIDKVELPKREPLARAYGTEHFASVPLLPAARLNNKSKKKK